jgi:hypothetical protein
MCIFFQSYFPVFLCYLDAASAITHGAATRTATARTSPTVGIGNSEDPATIQEK